MGYFIGTEQPVSKNTESDVTSYVAVATPAVAVGHVAWYKDSSGRVSALKYYQAAATISAGAALVKDTVSRNPFTLKMSTTAEGGLPVCKGIAAAAVSNTGYYSWAWISGYVPNAAINSGYASNTPMRLSATTTGKFGSIPNIAATAVDVTLAKAPVIWTLGSESSAAAATDVFTTTSAVILGWLQ